MLAELANWQLPPATISLLDSVGANLGASLVCAVSSSSGLSSAVVAADDAETEFQRERSAFRLLLPRLAQYRGQFVAIHEGQVVASDASRNALVRRFFEKYGESASVYIGFIGPQPIARVPTPFVVRH